MSAEQFLRILVVLAVWLGCALLVWSVRRHLRTGVRLSLDFTLGLYTVTFFVGACWFFVLQEAGIDRYFGGAMSAPDAPYALLLLLSSLPYLVIPPIAWLVQKTLPRRRRPIPHRAVRDLALWIGVCLSLLLVAAFMGSHAVVLVQNTFSDLSGTSNIIELYSRRRELFESLSSIQTGLLYGTLPACAALMLFHVGRARRLTLGFGGLLAALAVVINAGLFQIGPVLAFGLICAFCFVASRFGRVRLKQLLILGAAGAVALAMYHSFKVTDRDDEPNFALQLALRMPVALPYLFQMERETRDQPVQTELLPFELGEFMFPEFNSARRFISMPQPAFITAWYGGGVPAAVGVLAIIAGFVAMAGSTLRLTRQPRDGRLVMKAILISPILYYSFQSSLLTVLLSSYSSAYLAIPVVLVLCIDRLLSTVSWASPSRANPLASSPSTT